MTRGQHHRGPATKNQPPRRAVKRRKSVRRIPLKALEALSVDEVELGNHLLDLLPAPVPGERLLDELADEIEQLLGLGHDVFFHTMRTYPASELPVRLDEHFVTSFRLAPDPDVGLLMADMNLVGSWLEELLEDEPPEARRLPPPSDRDFGLISFILMQLVNWLCARGLPPLSLPTAPPNLEAISKRLRRQTEIAEVVFSVSSPRSAGLVRLLLPGDLVRSMEVFVAEASRRERGRRRLMTTRLGAIRAHLPVALGSLGLERAEWSSVGPGDVLLPQTHGLETDALEADGGAKIWLDRARRHYLQCRIRPTETDRWAIEITDPQPQSRHTRPQQGDATMNDQPKDTNQTPASGSSAALERAEVDVEMRVGSLPLPVSMLAQLQSGYVLELDRSVDDGVDLLVDGQMVGHGELVNVDGRLGVRVLSIEE